MQKKTIHRYEIIEQIGEGGMGLVYKARDPRIDRIVAIKTIKFGSEDDRFEVDEKMKRFYREAKTSGKLFHQNIVTILDVDEYEDFSYIVMEYVEGDTLARRLRGGQPLEMDEAVSIVIQVCDALQYAHGVGIIHRDIKPSNIMVIGQNQVKVADFGLAKMVASTSANITRTGGVVGTPFYMAPEQIRGDSTDGRADIFSLGVVLYECLTGAKPFVGDSISTIIYKILHEKPVGIREFDHGLSPELDLIVQKALAKSIDDRYQTAGDMGDDLRRCLYQERTIRERTASLEKTPSGKLYAVPSAADRVNDLTVGMPYPDRQNGSAHRSSPSLDSSYTVAVDAIDADEVRSVANAVKSPPRPGRLLVPLALASLIILGLLFFYFFRGPVHDQPLVSPTESQARVTEPTRPEIQPTVSSETMTSGMSTPTATETLFDEGDRIASFGHEAMLSVTGTPEKANVRLDNRDIGVTPLQTKVPAGSYTLSVSKEGYGEFTRTVSIDGSAEKPSLITYSLQPTVVKVSITSRPPGAHVSLDGRDLGVSPLAPLELKPATYNLRFSRKNYESLEMQLDVKAGKTESISPLLRSAGIGSLNINAVPWANIFVDGTNYQSTPRSIADLPSGVHSLRLTHPDYSQHEAKIEIPVNETVKIFHDFEKTNFGLIQVNADPWGNVFIDGQLEGETPISRRVKTGEHLVKITLEGHPSQEFSVVVKGGATEKITARFN